MFLAAIPMGSDIYFEPVWTQRIVPNQTSDGLKFSNAGVESYILGNMFGYFTPDGEILSAKTIQERVSVSPAAWSVYSSDAHDTPVFYPDGSLKITIAGNGFIHLNETRTYLFFPGGDGVSEFSNTGKQLWKREHIAPISAFNSSNSGTVIGYADGELTCMSPEGKEIFSFYPGGSDAQVILGAAISKDGSLVACVSGIDRQRFLLIRVSGTQSKILYHTYLEGNLRRQAFVNFESNGLFAFFETAQGLGIIDCKKLETHIIPTSEQIIAAGEAPEDALFVTLSKNDKKYTLSAIERPDHLIASTSFTAENVFLIQREKAIYLGTDDTISRIDIRGIK